MKKFIVLGNSEPESVEFEYGLGEVITVNSVDKYKCVDKIIKDGELLQYFKKGIPTFNY